jgi:hypothetical protein
MNSVNNYTGKMTNIKFLMRATGIFHFNTQYVWHYLMILSHLKLRERHGRQQFIANFKVLTQHFAVGTEGNHGKYQSG